VLVLCVLFFSLLVTDATDALVKAGMPTSSLVAIEGGYVALLGLAHAKELHAIYASGALASVPYVLPVLAADSFLYALGVSFLACLAKPALIHPAYIRCPCCASYLRKAVLQPVEYGWDS
jgi:hypothetical protein